MGKLIINNAVAIQCDTPIINSITVDGIGQVYMDYTVTSENLSSPHYEISSKSDFSSILVVRVGFAYTQKEKIPMSKLGDNSTFYIRVKKHCTGGGTSSWVTSQFTTTNYHGGAIPVGAEYKIANEGCGTGTNGVPAKINSISINGKSFAPSGFPLTSDSLYQTISDLTYTNFGGNNNIQLNVTGIPIEGYDSTNRFRIDINNEMVVDNEITSPYPSASVVINAGDNVKVYIKCF